MKRIACYILVLMYLFTACTMAVHENTTSAGEEVTTSGVAGADTPGDSLDSSGEPDVPESSAPDQSNPSDTEQEQTKPSMPPVGEDPGGFGTVF